MTYLRALWPYSFTVFITQIKNILIGMTAEESLSYAITYFYIFIPFIQSATFCVPMSLSLRLTILCTPVSFLLVNAAQSRNHCHLALNSVTKAHVATTRRAGKCCAPESCLGVSVQILAWTPVVPSDVCRNFMQSSQKNAWLLHYHYLKTVHTSVSAV